MATGEPTSLVSVYPNPATTIIRINGLETGAAVQLFSTDGKLALSQDISGTNLLDPLDLSGLPNGLYQYHILTGGKKVMDRLVKQ